MTSKHVWIDDVDVGESNDYGDWLGYRLSADGLSLEALIRDASVTETDKDGYELRTYGIAECDDRIYALCIEAILEHWYARH